MKESRFRISHVLLVLFLIGFGCAFGYLLIKAWIFAEFTPLMLLYIPTFCVAVILPIVSAILFTVNDIKKILAHENNSLYYEEETNS